MWQKASNRQVMDEAIRDRTSKGAEFPGYAESQPKKG
jgi:hypothetical protein